MEPRSAQHKIPDNHRNQGTLNKFLRWRSSSSPKEKVLTGHFNGHVKNVKYDWHQIRASKLEVLTDWLIGMTNRYEK